MRTGFRAPCKCSWGSRVQETQPWLPEAYPLKVTPFIIHTISLRNIAPYSFINVSPEVLLLCCIFSVFPYGKKLFLIGSGSPESKTLPPFLCIPQDSAQISHSFVLTSGSPLGTSQLFPTVQVHRFSLVLVQSSGFISVLDSTSGL